MNEQLINKIVAAKEIVVKSNLSEAITLFKNGSDNFMVHNEYNSYNYSLEEVHDLLEGKQDVIYYNTWRII